MNASMDSKALNKQLHIKDLMTTQVLSVGPDDTFLKVDAIFRGNNVHHIPVLVDGTVVGIVNKLEYKALSTALPIVDCSKKEQANHRLFQSLLIGEVMHKNPPVVQENDTLTAAMNIFRNNQEHAVLVINEDFKLVGILTTYDVLMHYHRLCNEAA